MFQTIQKILKNFPKTITIYCCDPFRIYSLKEGVAQSLPARGDSPGGS